MFGTKELRPHTLDIFYVSLQLKNINIKEFPSLNRFLILNRSGLFNLLHIIVQPTAQSDVMEIVNNLYSIHVRCFEKFIDLSYD